MNERDIFAVMAAYVGIYYFNAKGLLSWIKVIDTEYYKSLGNIEKMGVRNSFAVGKFLLDSSLPKSDYPSGFKFRLKLSRLMLLFFPVFFTLLLLFLD